ncbi:hypothetical protein SCH4B_1381 [Ruegeria sp. TrichCH4B]|nr:hypothetical protein SCH4B_1381 [Ruegeria sp. TrichCH4B]
MVDSLRIKGPTQASCLGVAVSADAVKQLVYARRDRYARGIA